LTDRLLSGSARANPAATDRAQGRAPRSLIRD
jgi:hypothetical protein